MKTRQLHFTALLLTSGFCGISYEVLYGRILGNLIGDQFAVSASILLTFLLGIGCGTFFAHRLWSGLWLIELGIGSIAALLALSSGYLDILLYSNFLHSGLAGPILGCVLILAAPAFLIGTSLPLFVGYLSRLAEGLAFPRAYSIYNLGAAAVVLLIEFLFIRELGIRGATLLIASLNAWVGLTLFFGFGDLRKDRPDVVDGQRIHYPLPQVTALAVSSIGSAVFQLLMIKLAEFVIGPFRETFALVLSLIFAGITLGATLVGRFRFRFKGLMVANCLSLLWIIIGFRIAVEFYARWYEAAAVSHVGSVGLKLGFLATIMLFPAATFGATIPALIREQSNPAKESGKLLCISSMGNVAGFLLMVLFLHPRFDYGLIILSVLGLSVLSLIVYEPRISLMTALGVGIALSGFNFHGKFWQEDLLYLGHTSFHSSEELREAVEDFEFPQRFRGPQDVFSITWSDGSPHFFVNGYISMVLDSPWEPMVGAFASVMAPRVDRALVLGLGSGATASVVGLIFDQTDAVEINGVVLENLYRMRAYNFDIENNPRVRIIHDDAIHFAKTSDEKYSLIINTVTTPLYFSSSKLYTKDFIDRIGSRLKHDGVYVTWVDSRVGSEGVNIILKTLGASFEHCAIGFIRSSYFLLFCSSEPLQPTQAGIVAQNPILGPHFVREFEIRPEWLAYGLLSTRALELIGSQEVPLNTLNYPALEFEMTRLRERGYTDFQDRLTDQMNLADLKRTLSGNLTWDPVSLLLHTEDVLGDSRFTRRWKELVGAEIDDLEERLASSEISVEEEFLEVVGSADLYHKLGFHFMENSRYRKAIAYFEKALELDTQRDNAYFNIGACYEYLRDYPLAIEFYKLEREVDPDDTDVPYRLGRVYVKVGHHQEAVRELDKAVERLDSASVQYYRGRAFEGLGATSRALESYREALSLEANHEEAWKALDRLGGAEE